jgi:hypothetical protein
VSADAFVVRAFLLALFVLRIVGIRRQSIAAVIDQRMAPTKAPSEVVVHSVEIGGVGGIGLF